MKTRRAMLSGLAAGGAVLQAGCEGAMSAAAVPTPTVEPTATPQPFQIRVQMIPQEARLGQDERVVVRATVLRRVGNQYRPLSGAQVSAIANLPSGPRTFNSEVTTFPDGRAPDLAIPVEPTMRGSNVRVEVVMRFQGQEFRQTSGFTVR
jgi:hypothetical protein